MASSHAAYPPRIRAIRRIQNNSIAFVGIAVSADIVAGFFFFFFAENPPGSIQNR